MSRPSRPIFRTASEEPLYEAPLRLTRRGRIVVLIAALLLVGIVVAAPVRATTLFEPPATRTVIVQPGQTMWQIAKQAAPHQDPTQTIVEILDLNGMHRVEMLHPGDRLVVPLPKR